ncbi:MAG: sigma-70 family RNA polymerase sigma factor [Oscillospiraceae bacterium]|nr:sigma-70 family RNA polymerase sigma factor [Oscillospiraceae bacterium]
MAIDIMHLTARARAGDADAFGRLYEEHARDMYRYALYALGSEGAAMDAVQDAALAAFRGIASLREAELFRPWIFRILANRCKRMLRGKYTARVESLEEQFRETAALDLPLGRALELRQAIARLSAAEREIVLLSVLDGYDSNEIGRTMGIPPGTVRSKLSRALAKLRKEISFL